MNMATLIIVQAYMYKKDKILKVIIFEIHVALNLYPSDLK